MAPQPRICLVSASGQNVFFAEILAAFRDALRERGLAVEESIDCFPPLADDLVYVFIAHEYHPMVLEPAHPSEAQLRRSIALCAEQPGTTWFEIVAEFAARAGAAIDINALGARELNRRGIPTEHAPLGYVPAWDVWQRRNGERPVDMTFLGRHADRRAHALARCASRMDRRRSAIHLTETFSPHVAGSPYFLTGDRRAQLLASSKVLLNIHQQELAYMEWHRVLSALLNGCVVVSEHSLEYEPLVPGKHFIAARYEDLPVIVEALLNDPDRQDRIRQAAYDLVRHRMPMTTAADALLRAVERVAQAPVVAPHPAPPQPQPLPKPAPERQPGWPADAGPAGNGLTAHVAESAPADPARDDVESLGPHGVGAPQISVLLTLHDGSELAAETLRSVALSDFDDIEVVAVVDGGDDEAAAALRAACAALPWLPARIVRPSRKGTVPAAARNIALAHARGELLFVLAAGNAIFPRGLDLLTGALADEPDTAFAYGVLQAVDDSGAVGLRSWLDWSADRLRHGNYIDAMTLVRRSALEAVGGYPTDPALAGWEDFAVWIALADAGCAGVRVPDFVGSHRLDPAVRETEGPNAWATLLRRYPSLARRAA